MIIARSPLRISLGGGGTDLPSYYSEHGGYLIAAAINRYVYLSVHHRFVAGFLLKYSQIEEAAGIADIRHPIIRAALQFVWPDARDLEITSTADIPAGTGLGSSGSFTTALLCALHADRGELRTAAELAEEACHVEIERLCEPVGKQDQYIAAVGGVTEFTFHPDGTVTHGPVPISYETRMELEQNLMLFFTGYSRSASKILKDQQTRSVHRDPAMLENLHATKELGLRSREALVAGRCDVFAALMHEHWERKKRRSTGMSNERIDAWYNVAREAGALGGKVIGAGGGGFLIFYAEDPERLRKAMAAEGLREVRFRFDDVGTTLIVREP
jgi:D-glycero-alpha-D-manno-heptose-7-phosphate kinase